MITVSAILQVIEAVFDNECQKRNAARAKGMIHAENVHEYAATLLASIFTESLKKEQEINHALET